MKRKTTNITKGIELKTDDLTEIMDSLHIESDPDLKKQIDFGKATLQIILYRVRFPLLQGAKVQ